MTGVWPATESERSNPILNYKNTRGTSTEPIQRDLMWNLELDEIYEMRLYAELVTLQGPWLTNSNWTLPDERGSGRFRKTILLTRE